MQLATDASSGIARLLTSTDVDELFTFASNGGPVRLADQYVGEWVDARRLVLYATNAPVITTDSDEGEEESMLVAGSGLTLSLRMGQGQLRLQGTAEPYLDASSPVSTSGVPLTSCFASNGTSAE